MDDEYYALLGEYLRLKAQRRRFSFHPRRAWAWLQLELRILDIEDQLRSAA